MKEIKEIIKRVSAFAAAERAVLATVIDVRGSGYRLPGARMLIRADGESFGTVSGGCLEADVIERAKRVLATGDAEVFTYDTTADETSVFSLNMGCRGVIRILLETVDNKSPIIANLNESYHERKQIAAAVVVASEVSGVRVGGRVFLGREDPHSFTDTGSLLSKLNGLDDDLLTIFGSDPAFETNEYDVDGGMVEMAFETLEPPVRLLIYGAGADGVPLAAVAGEGGWQAEVYDHRSAFLTKDRFPTADEIVLLDRDAPFSVDADRRTAIVAMNHNYDRDRAVIPAALESDAFYVGALGPKKRTGQILDELAAGGVIFTDAQLARLFAPAGIDIGADTPEAIAIVAEIQSVIAKRSGGHLRDREGSIYDRRSI